MATIVFPYDHARDPMNPVDLANRIAGALNLTFLPNVDIAPTAITVTAQGVGEGSRAAIQALIDAYVLDPDWANAYDGNLDALRIKARNALTANNAFLANQSPTQAQVLTQVRMLTRENTALIRLALGLTDSIEGT